MTETQSPLSTEQDGRRRKERRGRSLRPLILLVTLALVLGGIAWVLTRDGAKTTGGGTPAASGPAAITKIGASILPPISQTGARPASADKASGVVQVTATTEKPSAEVTLQVQRSSGWADLTTATLDKDGLASFQVPGGEKDSTSALRVVSSSDRQVRSASFQADGWTLGFDEQFGGDALDETKWGYRQVGMLNPGRTKSESSPAAVKVENGALELGVSENPARPGYYLNGHISTELTYSFTYGVAAARVKFQKPRGMHGSFWLQSPVFGSVPGDAKASGSEIDTVEYFGSTYPDGGLATFTYFKDKDGNSAKSGGLQTEMSDAIAKKGDAWWKKYHVFSVEWTPEAYVFRIDGIETFRQTKNISAVPEVLLLSLLSSDWELPDLDKSQLPADMKVDWVRVWQAAG